MVVTGLIFNSYRKSPLTYFKVRFDSLLYNLQKIVLAYNCFCLGWDLCPISSEFLQLSHAAHSAHVLACSYSPCLPCNTPDPVAGHAMNALSIALPTFWEEVELPYKVLDPFAPTIPTIPPSLSPLCSSSPAIPNIDCFPRCQDSPGLQSFSNAMASA